ncbi:MAG: NusG domain II-containing protein [Treponemataceae bacterium]|nr:NusG domain II-containing protein [Treponemataceae bacterium]
MKFKFSALRPLDFIILALLLAAGLFLTIKSLSKKGSKVIVLANGEQYEYSASNNGTYSVTGAIGETTFEIKEGKVHIIDSPCKNKICVNQGWSSPLICMPNNVLIRVEDGEDYDAISE